MDTVYRVEYRVERWKNGRFWAVYGPSGLVCVCVYRKGARALVAILGANP